MPASGKKACFQFPERSLGYAKICFFFQLRKRRQLKFAKPCPTEAPPGPRIAQPRRGVSHNYVNKIRQVPPARPVCASGCNPGGYATGAFRATKRAARRARTASMTTANGPPCTAGRPPPPAATVFVNICRGRRHCGQATPACGYQCAWSPRRPPTGCPTGRAARRHIALISRKQLQMTGKNSIFAIH